MIPADLASSLRSVLPDLQSGTNVATQPVAAAQKIADILSDAAPGQRILAEIQALLPNGSYRAIVAQREMTLALPFTAKPGDVIELEVKESEGELGLAFIANRSAPSATQAESSPSAATSLSRTGSLIGNLLGEIDQGGGKAKPALLNASQPIVQAFPANAAELVPVLKDALVKSGMFYEAHQAQWAEGKLPTASLLNEPQGKLSSGIPQATSRPSQSILTLPPESKAVLTYGIPPSSQASTEASVESAQTAPLYTTSSMPGQSPAQEALSVESPLPHSGQIAAPSTPANKSAVEDGSVNSQKQSTELNHQPPSNISNPADSASLASKPAIHPDLAPLVQQQLNALATQTFVWQGQIWPGQNMDWEISDDGQRKNIDQEATARWRTRLSLDMPKLGNVEARLQLAPGGRLELALQVDNPESQGQLRNASIELRDALKAAGLELSNFGISIA